MPTNIVPTDSKSIYDITKMLSEGSSFAIVRPNNPPVGIAGYVFDIVGNESVDLKSDITDHYVEDNTAIQDHIALSPETVSITGLVAELTAYKQTEVVLIKQPDPLPLEINMMPVFSVGGIQAINIAGEAARATAEAVIANATLASMYESRVPIVAGNRQSRAFGYFHQLWNGRAIFTVETPWGIFTSMAIESITANQSGETRTVSEFTIKFKKMRFAESVNVNVGELAGRAAMSNKKVEEKGKATSAPADTKRVSAYYQLITWLGINANKQS